MDGWMDLHQPHGAPQASHSSPALVSVSLRTCSSPLHSPSSASPPSPTAVGWRRDRKKTRGCGHYNHLHHEPCSRPLLTQHTASRQDLSPDHTSKFCFSNAHLTYLFDHALLHTSPRHTCLFVPFKLVHPHMWASTDLYTSIL